MSNFKLTIQYDGHQFEGFQSQTRIGSRTVQGELNNVVAKLSKDKELKVIGASRTDAGVHALGQVVNVHLPFEIKTNQLIQALNSNLPNDIEVIKVQIVSDDFHARKSAHAKRYRYKVFNGKFVNPFKRFYTGHFRYDLDVELMKKASKDFLGEHDFSTFAAAGNQTINNIRTITRIDIIEVTEEKEIHFVFEGDAFLYNQIRIMVGVLLEIGNKRRPVNQIPELIDKKDRAVARFTAPASGLYLEEIYYK